MTEFILNDMVTLKNWNNRKRPCQAMQIFHCNRFLYLSSPSYSTTTDIYFKQKTTSDDRFQNVCLWYDDEIEFVEVEHVV